MLLTVWCVGVVLTSILFVGIPLTWLLSGRKPLNEWGWIQVPFLGIAAIILILQNLVYLDVPIKLSAPFLWGAGGLLWWFLWRSGHLRVSLARFPRALYAAMLLVYLVQGLGLITVGARYYIGRGWGDQINYDITATFLAEERHSTTVPEAADRPCYCHIISSNCLWDRLGQSVLHAFFAVSCHASSKSLFEPTAMLVPTLVVAALYALGLRFRLRRRLALMVGLVGGLMPAVTVIHQESFFSHALGTPFLLYLPAALHELSERPDRSRLLRVALVLAAGASIYTEYWLFLVGVTVLVLGFAIIRHPRRWRLLGCTLILVVSALLFNPGSWRAWLTIMGRLQVDSPSDATYPWSLTLEGLCRLWIGEIPLGWGGRKLWLVRFVGLTATLLGACGLFLGCWRQLAVERTSWRRSRHWAALGLATAILALAVVPLLIVARNEPRPYQFYKVLLSVSPLLALGLALLAQPPQYAGEVARLPFRLFACLALGTTLIAGAAGTIEIAYRTSRSAFTTTRCPAYALLAPEMRQLQVRLERLRGKNLLITSLHGCQGIDSAGYLNGWCAYFARHNRAWLTDPMFNMSPLAGWRKAVGLPDAPPESVRDNLLLLASNKHPLPPSEGTDARRLWSNGAYELWQLGRGAWAVPIGLKAPSVLMQEGQHFFWLGKDGATLEIMASAAGTVTVTGKFDAAPNLPPTSTRTIRVQVTGPTGKAERELTGPGIERTFTVPVQAGRNVIAFVPLDAPHGPLPRDFTEPVLWGVKGLRLKFVSASSAGTASLR
jgi:hypothetical protein